MRSTLRQLASTGGAARATDATALRPDGSFRALGRWAVGLAVAASPSVANAQGIDEFGPYGGLERLGQTESPQYMAFEARFGPYLPEVDQEFGGGATPFRDTFGKKNRYLVGIELDWQALRIPKLGTLGPGFGAGYTRARAKALLNDGTGSRSAQDTSLAILPMYVVGVLRVDVLARDTPIPLLPYVKAGLGYALWWVNDAGSRARDASGTKGQGRSYGLQYALGGMLLLDALDPEAAIEMDNTTGVNNSYWFLEWYVSDLDCGNGNCMQVGANTWMTGLALDI